MIAGAAGDSPFAPLARSHARTERHRIVSAAAKVAPAGDVAPRAAGLSASPMASPAPASPVRKAGARPRAAADASTSDSRVESGSADSSNAPQSCHNQALGTGCSLGRHTVGAVVAGLQNSRICWATVFELEQDHALLRRLGASGAELAHDSVAARYAVLRSGAIPTSEAWHEDRADCRRHRCHRRGVSRTGGGA